MCRWLSTGWDEESKPPDSRLAEDRGIICQRTLRSDSSRSQCSPKVPRNASAGQNKPPVRLRPGRCSVRQTGVHGGLDVGRAGTDESDRRCIENVLMDVDDFEHEVTV